MKWIHLSSIQKVISDNKGELTDTKILGKRQLAYPINNMNFANYVHLDLKIDKKTLQALEEKFKFDQDVYRHLTVKNWKIICQKTRRYISIIKMLIL